MVVGEVEEILESETSVLYNIIVDGERIKTTKGHPFYLKDKDWVKASDLEVGDILVTDDEEVEVLQILIEYLAEQIIVYNFTVKQYHNYFVTDLEVLTHNVDKLCRVDNEWVTEGEIGTYRELKKKGNKFDDLTPHHMPSKKYMQQYGISENEGLSIMIEQPNKGGGGRHRKTKTYGRKMTNAEKKAYYNLSPREALAHDLIDLKNIFTNDPDINFNDFRYLFNNFIDESIKLFPELFKKSEKGL